MKGQKLPFALLPVIQVPIGNGPAVCPSPSCSRAFFFAAFYEFKQVRWNSANIGQNLVALVFCYRVVRPTTQGQGVQYGALLTRSVPYAEFTDKFNNVFPPSTVYQPVKQKKDVELCMKNVFIQIFAGI